MWHLLHPGLVHFAVAFLIAGALIEAASLLARKPRWDTFGSVLVVIGTLALLPTIVSGFLAQNSVPIPAGAAATMTRHENVGLALLAFFSGLLFWKAWLGGSARETQRWPYALLLLAGAALAAYGAFLGGEMVYVHGVGVRVD